MHPVVYVGWLRPYHPSEALMESADFVIDPEDYIDYSALQDPEKILEKCTTRTSACCLVKWKNTHPRFHLGRCV
jgi:hypothetical protein